MAPKVKKAGSSVPNTFRAQIWQNVRLLLYLDLQREQENILLHNNLNKCQLKNRNPMK